MYKFIQEQEVQKCEKESISYSDYASCKKDNSKSYQSYENERQELMQNKSSRDKSSMQQQNQEE